MKLKTIAKLFGAVVEDEYGSPQRDATLPGWFKWYLDHMPVRENVYGTLMDIGLTGTQANVIIERIWPQIASIQQEAIDLAKAGNESGAIAKLNEAASLAERLAREAAEHERLLGRGIEPEPPRRMEERDMAAQAERADWPRQVVERDNYILINDYLGAGYAQANPELVETLVRIAADYLLARPDVAFDNLWAYTYDALKKMYPARERGIEVGGGMMEASTIAKMFGAREQRTYAQHFGRVRPDTDEVENADLYKTYYDVILAEKFMPRARQEIINELAKEGMPEDFIGNFLDGWFLELLEDAKHWIYGRYSNLEKVYALVYNWGLGQARHAYAEKEFPGKRIPSMIDYVERIKERLVDPRIVEYATDLIRRGEASEAVKADYEDGFSTLVYTLAPYYRTLASTKDAYTDEELNAILYGPVFQKAKDLLDRGIVQEKTGGGIMPKLLSLRSILMAAASLGDLLSLLRKVKEPTKEVSAAIKKLEGMVAKYDEGAKLEDVNTAAMKRILANLKKVPKPTKDQPRTRVLKAVKLLEDLLKTKVSSAVLQASIVQVARILKAVDEPTDEVKAAIKLADQLAKSYEEGGPKKYGKVVSVEGMTKLLKMLEAIEEKPDPVVKAVAALKKLLGAEEEKPTAPGERGELPSYGLAKLEAAIKPGVYWSRLIRAGEALDGTMWPEEQLKIAFEKGYFEGVPVNAISYTGQYGPDIEYHLPLDTEVAGKVVGNQVGFTKDTKWDDEEHAGYGYVYITETERRNLIDAMLEQGIDAPGMSIYADGMKDENDIVTGINGVTSMDLVTFPAADGAILSQALTASVKEWGALRKKLQAGEPVVATVTPDDGTISEIRAAAEGRTPKQHFERIYSKTVAVSKKRLANYIDELHGYVFEGELADTKENHAAINAGIKKLTQALTKSTYSKNEADRIKDAAEKALWQVADRLWEEQEGKRTKTGGGIMSPTALEQRLDVVEKISQGLNERVAQADTDGMIELKLQASKLPDKVQAALRRQLLGKQLTEEEVDSFIKFQQGITDDLATELAATAHVTLGGGVLPGEGKDTLKGALTALFEKQK